MSRLRFAHLAGVATATLAMISIPAAAHPSGHGAEHAKPAVHAKAHATTHATTHATVHAHEGAASAGYTRVKTHPTHASAAHATLSRIEDESTERFHVMGRTATPVGHVTMQRSAFRVVTQHRAALSNARFVTGTVVSRPGNAIVLRTQSGNTVTVLTQSVPVAASVLAPGATVVLPVQYVNGQVVLVPSFSQADQTAFSGQPVLAPCAINDHDADDAGDTGYYAPANACLNNDGDADDGGYAFTALPSSFGTLPQVFTSSYAPAVVSGFVVTQIGQNVLLMTPDFKPLVINASAAMSSGAMNGSLTPGRYVVAYGFNVNNTFVATSLM